MAWWAVAGKAVLKALGLCAGNAWCRRAIIVWAVSKFGDDVIGWVIDAVQGEDPATASEIRQILEEKQRGTLQPEPTPDQSSYAQRVFDQLGGMDVQTSVPLEQPISDYPTDEERALAMLAGAWPEERSCPSCCACPCSCC